MGVLGMVSRKKRDGYIDVSGKLLAGLGTHLGKRLICALLCRKRRRKTQTNTGTVHFDNRKKESRSLISGWLGRGWLGAARRYYAA